MTLDSTSQKQSFRIGYARVSTHEQCLDLQWDALRSAGCKRIYSDKVSGLKSDRPQLNQLREMLRMGDTLVVWRLDRLGRSLKDLIAWAEWCEQERITLWSLQEQINTGSSSGKLVFHLFAALAQFERNVLQERTQAGLKAARARGCLGGGPRRLTCAQHKQLMAMHADHSIGIEHICQTLKISRSTLYRTLRDVNAATLLQK